MARLVVTQGPDKGRQFKLAGEMVIGRLKQNAVFIRDTKASREHSRIYREGKQYMLLDLGSRNGTCVNGEKISRHALVHGDRISVGNTVLRFIGPRPAAEPGAPPTGGQHAKTTSAKTTPAVEGVRARPGEPRADAIEAAPRWPRAAFWLQDLAQRPAAYNALVVFLLLLLMGGVALVARWITLGLLD